LSGVPEIGVCAPLSAVARMARAAEAAPGDEAVVGTRQALQLPPPWSCGDAVREQFRRLVPAVLGPSGAPAPIGVCSVGAGEGRSWVTAGLACAVAESGRPVVVGDAQTARPTLALWFGADGQGAAARQVSADRELLTQISVMDACAGSAGPGAFGSALQRLHQRTGVVLVEVNPIRDSSQAFLLAGALGGVLLVVAAERERREVIARAVEALGRQSMRSIGLVMNRRVRAVPEFLYRWL
jgi:Mrp family chromosome partitioning ATPase